MGDERPVLRGFGGDRPTPAGPPRQHPAAFGGLLVATLVLSPEALAAARAALASRLQRSVDIWLRSVLATISLTLPSVLTIGLTTGQTVILGLGAADTTLLLLTLALSTSTFASTRTNVLLGAVHFLLFLAYVLSSCT
jgi:Ca2+:H+ antiporter